MFSDYEREYDAEDFVDGAEFIERRFRDPGGQSALHPGRRSFECPTCKEPNSLTARDVRAGYQCDACADRAEGGGY